MGIKITRVAPVFLASSLALAQSQNPGQITITNRSGQPVSEATVIIGWAENNPFAGNTLITDGSGKVTVPPMWKETLPVTIEGRGLARTTSLNVRPGEQTLTVQTEPIGRSRPEFLGKTVGYADLKKNDRVDLAIVIPALGLADLLDFELGMVLSPEADTVRVLTETLAIPSNVSLPKQSESYVLPITLEKPIFRLPVQQPGEYLLTAIHSQFPLKSTVDRIRGGASVFEVINSFEVKGLGQAVANTRSASQQKFDINVGQISPDRKVTARAPDFSGDREMITLALARQGDWLFPTDVKRLKPKETLTLKTLRPPGQGGKDGQGYLLSALVPKAESLSLQLRLAIQETLQIPVMAQDFLEALQMELDQANRGQVTIALEEDDSLRAPQFLSPALPPQVIGDTIVVAPPTLPTSVAPHSVRVILSELELIKNGQYETEMRKPVWYVHQSAWPQGEMRLPRLRSLIEPKKRYRWELLFAASRQSAEGKITHVTRSVFDF